LQHAPCVPTSCRSLIYTQEVDHEVTVGRRQQISIAEARCRRELTSFGDGVEAATSGVHSMAFARRSPQTKPNVERGEASGRRPWAKPHWSIPGRPGGSAAIALVFGRFGRSSATVVRVANRRKGRLAASLEHDQAESRTAGSGFGRRAPASHRVVRRYKLPDDGSV
jgi:hypothetical protein